ncbi:hypothetical protein IMZ48_15315 [Candidatus Bathyarchaeota archaeon]|nr:hypothetical protein [Candidatus Bathyarchaeota archaeon]
MSSVGVYLTSKSRNATGSEQGSQVINLGRLVIRRLGVYLLGSNTSLLDGGVDLLDGSIGDEQVSTEDTAHLVVFVIAGITGAGLVADLA